MIFSKTKKLEAENYKLRFVEHTLRSFLRDVKKIDRYDISDEIVKKEIDEMIEYRAKEIRDWI